MFPLAWHFKDLAQIMEVQLISSAGGNHSLLHFTAVGGPRQTQNIIKDRGNVLYKEVMSISGVNRWKKAGSL